MNTNTQEALAKVASISEGLDGFAKSISMQKITIFPITMIGENSTHSDDLSLEDYQDDTIKLIGQDDRHHMECLGCMDCLGMSWRDFL